LLTWSSEAMLASAESFRLWDRTARAWVTVEGGCVGLGDDASQIACRGLVPIAEVHAIIARAHLAQSEPETARDRFGFLERHGFVAFVFGSTHEAADTASFGRPFLSRFDPCLGLVTLRQ
jgi:hypothetical protein